MKESSLTLKMSLLLLLVSLTAGCGTGKQTEIAGNNSSVSLISLVKNGNSDFFAIPENAYSADNKNMPIGVFDSGIGGLTVLAEILKLDEFDNTTHERGADGRPDFENERFIYLGDQANMPYGNYSAENNGCDNAGKEYKI